jgi:hypothetical protein
VAWVYENADGLNGVHRAARDQWLRASPGNQVCEQPAAYGGAEDDFDTDPDSDFDLEKRKSRPEGIKAETVSKLESRNSVNRNSVKA